MQPTTIPTPWSPATFHHDVDSSKDQHGNLVGADAPLSPPPTSSTHFMSAGAAAWPVQTQQAQLNVWKKEQHPYSSWGDASGRDDSFHQSRGSIWGGDHIQGSPSSFGSFNHERAYVQQPVSKNEDSLGSLTNNNNAETFESSFSHLSIGHGNNYSGAHQVSISSIDSQASGYIGYPTTTLGPRTVSQDNQSLNFPSGGYGYYNQGSNMVPSSSASMGSSVPGLVGASSGSTSGASLQLSWQPQSPIPNPYSSSISNISSAMGVIVPPGFDTSSGKANYSGEGQGVAVEPASPDPTRPRGGRRGKNRDKQRSNRKQKGRYGKDGTGPLDDSLHSDNLDNNSSHSLSSSQRPHFADSDATGSSEAIRQLMNPIGLGSSVSSFRSQSTLHPTDLDRSDRSSGHSHSSRTTDSHPILPQQPPPLIEEDYLVNDSDEDDGFLVLEEDDEEVDEESWEGGNNPYGQGSSSSSPRSKKREWLLRMNRKLDEIPVGELDPASVPISAVMNAWAKTKSAQGASMVEMWLKRVQQEHDVGNRQVVATTKMYTMAVDAWARSGEGGAAAQRAEALLQHMHERYQTSGNESLRPSNAIFNAVINAWARSREKLAPMRAEQILNWMQNLQNLDIRPDKYTFNTVIHAWAKAGGTEAATKAQELLARMHKMFQEGNALVKPDTISYNVVINAWAKSGGKGAAAEAEKLLAKMHRLHKMGDPDVKPNVVTYGAVIDSFAKSGERGAASRADTLLANMIEMHQKDPIKHADLMPNTYVFNTVINCWAKSKEHDAASKAEEMLVAMSRLHASGMPTLKPDNFTYTAVIDAWAKSGYRGAAERADQLLDKMEDKYLHGDTDLKPNSYTYNAVICALAKSGEPGAAARAERVLHNMVTRHRTGGDDDVKPTTINFNTVLDAWAKSGGGRSAAERAEEILRWMDDLHKAGNPEVKVDTISFNAVLDAWARSGDRIAPRRAEQILDHMDELFRAGNAGVKPDRYTYNTLINVWAKSGERGSAERAEHVLSVMEKRFRDGDQDFKPNTRTYTSVIDAWAKSGEKGAAQRAEQILNNMISRYEAAGDPDVKPNVHTSNAVCNACAFSKKEEDRQPALQIAFRVFDWLSTQPDMNPDSYTYTILLSVCANLLPREDQAGRFAHARAFFERCRDAGYVNDYVLRKLRQTVTEDEYLSLVDYRTEASAGSMPSSWTRNAKLDSNHSKGGRNKNWSNNRRRGGGK